MIIRPIETEEDYEHLLNWVDTQFDLFHTPDSPEGKQLQTALLLIKDYEDIHYVVPTTI